MLRLDSRPGHLWRSRLNVSQCWTRSSVAFSGWRHTWCITPTTCAPNPDGTKIGGHQASSTSLVTILTALYFHFLRPGDRVSIKPHASPAFHAVQYLLGRLPRRYLATLRAYGGLQAYPSRTKDPDDVDFSTGSVGLGAVAPAFAALAHRYAKLHFVTSHRDALLRWWAMPNWMRAMSGKRSSTRRWKVWTT
jgi:pyruvate dehydrogenase complex dehydrogenase (E1) component